MDILTCDVWSYISTHTGDDFVEFSKRRVVDIHPTNRLAKTRLSNS